jgi:hypothetical protein
MGGTRMRGLGGPIRTFEKLESILRRLLVFVNRIVELATDNFDYYIWLKGALVEVGAELWQNTGESVNERLKNPEIKTTFEIKYEVAGRDLYYLELQR